MVEVLAGQEQGDCGVDRLLAADLGGIADAGEELSGVLLAGGLWRRYGPANHQREPERGVPGLEWLKLALQVLSTTIESGVAVRQVRQAHQRLGCPAHARHAADERRDILDVH